MNIKVLYSRVGYGCTKGEEREVTTEYGNLLISKGLAVEVKSKSRKDNKNAKSNKGSDT